MLFSIEQINKYCDQHFGLSGSIKPLMGEADYNYLLNATNDQKYLIKISRSDSSLSLSFLDFQKKILEYLVASEFPLMIPEVLISKSGKSSIDLGQNSFLRIYKWIPGKMLAEANPRSENLLEQWGNTAGLLTKHLQGFDHPDAHRFYKWNPSETLFSKQYFEYFHSAEERKIANHFWNLFEENALPKLSKFRKSVNYNDAHEHNLLINSNWSSPEIVGVIDFGDALFTETINELAIACAYAGMNQPDPIRAMYAVVKGYHLVFPLEEQELEILFELITARLLITVSSAAWNKHKSPQNEYLLISEQPAWDLLKRLYLIAPNFAHYRFRTACGLEPCKERKLFEEWLGKNGGHLHPVIKFWQQKIIPLDLSVGSVQLGAQANFESIPKFEKRIHEILEEQGAAFGIGGYNEARPFYTTSAYQVKGNQGAQWRTIHLGVDVWAKAGTPIFAPTNAVVQAVKNNDAERDYGPTLILKHSMGGGKYFYSLYGHLGMEVLVQLKAGQTVNAGEQIATIGAAPFNGNWPPHLHFQLMLDLLGNEGDFPGAVFPNETETWMSICPNPVRANETGFFPQTIHQYKPLLADEILTRRRQQLGSSLSVSYEHPLHMVRGYRQWLYAVDGRRYLDTVNNVAHVGHQHPKVINSAKCQIDILNTNTRYLHQNIVEYSEALLSTFPEELCVVHFVNSGSEANELAMRMVAAYNGQRDMIAMEVGYHGNTNRTIDISSYKFDGKGGKGKPDHTHIVPMPDGYRGVYQGQQNQGKKYAAYVQQAIDGIEKSGRSVGAYIGESILSCGGQIVLPNGYLKEVYKMVRAKNGLCIADEVQVGFGRVGEKFWGFELQEVLPDIVTLGKPMGNGHPLAAVVCTRAVSEAFSNGMEYFNTFGGNPVSCAIGKSVLNIIKEEKLQENAKEVGMYLKASLEDLKIKFPIIGDVRGYGLFLGIELVRDVEKKWPASERCTYLVNRMRARGILMSVDGPDQNVLKIKPPMCFGKSDADYLLENLTIVLSESFMQCF